MAIAVAAEAFGITQADIRAFIDDLRKRLSDDQFNTELSGINIDLSKDSGFKLSEIWPIARVAFKHGFFDLLPVHCIPPISYDITAHFDMLGEPLGFEGYRPVLPLINRQTSIAGYKVDFPLGLPASVLAANAKWIEFYAHMGFDILTYKTVRSSPRGVHPYPNWVFIDGPQQLGLHNRNYGADVVTAYPGFWPTDISTASMANSFGIPSFAPEWWKEDIRRAKSVIRDGHQILIVSVVASTTTSEDAVVEDFVKTAMLARQAGADIIEANYSCPNVPGDPIGEVYQYPDFSARISKALKEAVHPTPLFTKIGYLPMERLHQFVSRNYEYIDGIVAINTISAEVKGKNGEQSFPGRPTAGVSGWAIQDRAIEVAKNLVTIRDEIANSTGKRVCILGLGGVLTASDFRERLASGVDAVETCTGAFLNPYLGLEIRADTDALRSPPSKLLFELKVAGMFFSDVLLHPFRRSHLAVDRNTRQAVIEYE